MLPLPGRVSGHRGAEAHPAVPATTWPPATRSGASGGRIRPASVPSKGLMPGRRNMIFVFSDQHRARTTGYESAAAQTLVMDRMATERVVFDTAVSSTPVCTPWRPICRDPRSPNR